MIKAIFLLIYVWSLLSILWVLLLLFLSVLTILSVMSFLSFYEFGHNFILNLPLIVCGVREELKPADVTSMLVC